jgi:hypothetical protein
MARTVRAERFDMSDASSTGGPLGTTGQHNQRDQARRAAPAPTATETRDGPAPWPSERWRETAKPAARSVQGAGGSAPSARLRTLLPWARTAAAQAWRAARQTNYSAALNDLSPSYWTARRWSPLLAPVLLEAALLLLAFLLHAHPVANIAVTRGSFIALAAALLVAGALLGVALYAAPNDTDWTALLGLGVIGELILASLVLLGPAPTALVAVALAMAAGAFVRQRLHPVMEGTVHVTTLFGKYNRTLLPGLNVLLPGERVLAILPTRLLHYTTLPQRVATATGQNARATASIAYQLVPEEAHRAVLVVHDWERNLRQLLVAALRDELAHWGSQRPGADADPVDEADAEADGQAEMVSNMPPSDIQRLARRVGHRMRDQLLPWGVRFAHLRLIDVILPPQPERQAGEPVPSQAAPIVVEGSLVSSASASAFGRPALAAAAPRPGAAPDSLLHGATQPLGYSPAADTASAAARRADERAPAARDIRWPAKVPRLLSRLAGLAGGWRRDGLSVVQRHPSADAQAQSGSPSRDRAADRAGDRPARPDPKGGSVGASGPRSETPSPRPDDDPASLAAPSPRVLEMMYETVREGRITEPATIRAIADAFEDLAARAGDDPDATEGIDAEAAARVLRQHADELALRGGPAPSGETTGQSPRAARRPTPPHVERDENLTAGG